MLNKFGRIDAFLKNIIIVFSGNFIVNFLNLLFQLLIAHKLSPSDFAAFNSLLSIFMLVIIPLSTLQLVVAKYSAEYKARGQPAKLKFLLSDFTKKGAILAGIFLIFFWFVSGYILKALKIHSAASGYIFAALIAISCLIPVCLGAAQGLELFSRLSFALVITGILKLTAAFVLIVLGHRIAGALSALFISNLINIFIFYFFLKGFISLRAAKEDINYKEVLGYIFPAALSSFCFIALVNMDMILVKYFFASQEAGLYSLSQMVGKIFLFLPGAISIVMFPRVSGLNAGNLDTTHTLKRSLLYALALCVIACLVYNLFPAFVLKILTGKAFAESIVLGRFFSFSMSLFSLLFLLIHYFLSIKDLRFIKYLVLSALLQFAGVILFHKSLFQVQAVLCINAGFIFVIFLFLSAKKANIVIAATPQAGQIIPT